MNKEVVLNNDSGLVKFQRYGRTESEFYISDVIAIGEVTTDHGPFSDDHFLMFITKDKMWTPIPTDAGGFDDLTNYVSAKLGVNSFIQFANLTEFRSRIVYPKHLESKGFIKLERMKAKNWIENIGYWLGVKDRYKIIALSEVYDKLNIG